MSVALLLKHTHTDADLSSSLMTLSLDERLSGAKVFNVTVLILLPLQCKRIYYSISLFLIQLNNVIEARNRCYFVSQDAAVDISLRSL